MENIFDITNTESSLFDAFCKQTRRTLWTFLHTLAQQEDIYSIHLTNFGPYKEPDLNDYYVFCNGQEIVVLFKDAYTLKQEKADMESGKGGGIHVDGIVPVLNITRFLKRRADIVAPEVKIQSIMLSDRVCRDDLLDNMYDIEFPFSIIDNIRTLFLKKRTIEVNEQHGEKGKSIIDAILHCNCTFPEDEDTIEKDIDKWYEEDEDGEDEEKVPYGYDEDYDDFRKRLDEFLIELEEEDKAKFRKDLENAFHSNEDENGNEDDNENGTNSEIDDDDVFRVDDEDDYDKIKNSSPFSSSHVDIEQNATTNIKVEILRCTTDPREELNKLVGCTEIKRRMEELVSLSTYNKLIRKHFPDSKQHEISLHSVFFGRPGTGKTTVCKIFGALLHEAGALSSGHVVVCDRSTFVGNLWGDEEHSMREVLDIAKGGVLMIDEAYLLNTKHDHDPGKIAIQLLMSILADESKRDIAVVMCGYKEPMKKLLAMNPGLDSRFPNKFEFQDFNVDELLEITKRRINEYEYHFTNTAWNKYRQILMKAYQMRDPETWGNARFVANQLERIYIQHASRCVSHCPEDISEIRTLTADDIQPIEVPKPRMRIGF